MNGVSWGGRYDGRRGCEGERGKVFLRLWGVLISGHWTNYKRCVPDRVKGFWGIKKETKGKLSIGKWKYPVTRCFHVGRNSSRMLSDVSVSGTAGYQAIFILSVQQRTVRGVATRGTMGGVVTSVSGCQRNAGLLTVMRRICTWISNVVILSINVIAIIFLYVHFGFELDLNLTIDEYCHVLTASVV